ncbi:uncharacterized protein N0V89_009277 [Didymosphaeria variabile]|uniref:Mitochondrial import inner membrane translocase subunit TIM50 n=1 Tax=Didymosphaeria variabile TaxID=1932322 RepID=A0A9W8XDG2_9PLEO|nr:uncharacterized protein N0V89_009277 [Didymosphaeria variabile]KAJ4347905.1 hypothetical protein N0V89_009277 [Didymosphaeria variabile]
MASSPLRYNSHLQELQSANANVTKSKLATATEVATDKMNNTANNQLPTQPQPNNGNNRTNFPPPAHALPPRPSLPPDVKEVLKTTDNGLTEDYQRVEAYRQEQAQRHQQRPAPGQLPNHSGFFTGNLPLSGVHGAPPFAGSFGLAQPGSLNANHSLSHYFTGQGPFNSAPPPPPPPSDGGLPPFFTGGFPPPPPPPPMTGSTGNTVAHPFAQNPRPLLGLPHFAQPTPNMSRSQVTTSQPKGPPMPNGPKEKKKDPKIYLPAPIPTHQYMKQASLQAEVRIPPSRKLVILDLNGTLLYRPNSRNQPRKMIARPFLKQFLAYLFDNFAVMVWSSAKPDNVNVLVEIGLEEYRHRLIACWARDTLGLEPKHYSLNVQCYKNLHTIWASKDIQCHMPGHEFGAHFDQRNTILIDDSSLKAAAQPHNLLEIPEFKGPVANVPVQDVLSEVVGYLEVLKMQEDVSKFIHKDPFRANGDWRMDWNDLALDALQNHFSSPFSAK